MLQNAVEILTFFLDVTLWSLVEGYQSWVDVVLNHMYGKRLTALLIVLKMEAARVPEPPIYFYQTVGYPILEGGRPLSQSDEILRCRQLLGRLYFCHVRWAILNVNPPKYVRCRWFVSPLQHIDYYRDRLL